MPPKSNQKQQPAVKRNVVPTPILEDTSATEQPANNTPADVVPPVETPAPTQPATAAADVQQPPVDVKPADSVPAEEVPVADVPSDNESVASLSQLVQDGSADLVLTDARIRQCMDTHGLNKTLNAKIAEVKEPLLAYKLAKQELASGTTTETVRTVVEKNGKQTTQTSQQQRPLTEEEVAARNNTVNEIQPLVDDLENKLDAYRSARTRFSANSSHILGLICNELLDQLVFHAMSATLAQKAHIVKIKHLFSENLNGEYLSSTPFYPLVSPLEIIVKTKNELDSIAAAAAKKHEIDVLLANADKMFRTKYSIKVPRAKAAAAQPNAAASTTAATSKTETSAESSGESCCPTADRVKTHHKPVFGFYIGEMFKQTKNKYKHFKDIRVSDEVKVFLDKVLVAFIARLMPMVQIVADCMKNKTIGEAAIEKTVELLLIDMVSTTESFSLESTKVVDPEAAKEESRKAAEAKKAGTEYVPDTTNLPLVDGYRAVREVAYGSVSVEIVKNIVLKAKADAVKQQKTDEVPAEPSAGQPTEQPVGQV